MLQRKVIDKPTDTVALRILLQLRCHARGTLAAIIEGQ